MYIPVNPLPGVETNYFLVNYGLGYWLQVATTTAQIIAIPAISATMIFICSNNLSPCFLVSGEIYLYPCDIFVSILGYWLQVAGDQVTCWLSGY